MNDFDIIRQFASTINANAKRTPHTAEQQFRKLDVQVGDRVRMTEAHRSNPYEARTPIKDGSTLEGKVIGIKERDGKTQLRIAGFGHTGPDRAGGQYVWFPVENYKVEVLHKAYRLTDDDRLLAATLDISEDRWCSLPDTSRENYRRMYGDRVEKIKALLAPTVGTETTKASF